MGDFVAGGSKDFIGKMVGEVREVDDVGEILHGLGHLPPLELRLYHDGVRVGAGGEGRAWVEVQG